jgi:heme-degrading monooxygenase HmoA
MIQEVVILKIKPNLNQEFEVAFKEASSIIATIPGYIDHSLQKCIEVNNQYLLLVEWETLEAHTISFRESPQYQTWKGLLHHFYDPFPTVEHYQKVL